MQPRMPRGALTITLLLSACALAAGCAARRRVPAVSLPPPPTTLPAGDVIDSAPAAPRNSATLTVDDAAVLLGKPFDADAVASAVGARPKLIQSYHGLGGPQDERHYYGVPPVGLQMLTGRDRVVHTLYFMIEGDSNVAPYSWSLRNGVGRDSRPADVRARLGPPEASGPGLDLPRLRTGPWERFRYPPFGSLHIQYSRAGDTISMMTLMTESALPR